MKKGQVSIFILIVLVIILASVFVSYIKISSTEKIENEVEGRVSEIGFAEPVKNYVESCLKGVSENSVGVIGIQEVITNIQSIIYRIDIFSILIISITTSILCLQNP